MKNLAFICLAVCLSAVFVTAQDQPPFSAKQYPFKIFDNAVKEEVGGFSGDKSKLSRAFSWERSQLDDAFEAELWKYLGSDVEKHYWIGAFVNSKSYLHGEKPLPLLAFNIWQNGIKLVESKEDEESVRRKYSLMILSAVLAEQLGKKDIAVSYKNEVESLFDSKPQIVGGSFPAMYKNELCIYNNIGNDTSICKEEVEQQKLGIVSAGVLNERATYFPALEYRQQTKRGKILGYVSVRIVVDVDGRVIAAKGFEGRRQLFNAAIKAAKKAKFNPLILSGKPVKFSGILIYKFNKQPNL